MSETYFTSDTHYSHINICGALLSKWDSGYRDFSTLEEMNAHLINAINDTVKEKDILYHLGDWSFGPTDKVREFREAIRCKNVHLILGNHDKHIRTSKTLQLLFTSVHEVKEIKIEGRKVFMSHYPHRDWPSKEKESFHLHGHVHGRWKTKIERVMDVGVDTQKSMRPYSWEEVKGYMSLVEFMGK